MSDSQRPSNLCSFHEKTPFGLGNLPRNGGNKKDTVNPLFFFQVLQAINAKQDTHIDRNRTRLVRRISMKVRHLLTLIQVTRPWSPIPGTTTMSDFRQSSYDNDVMMYSMSLVQIKLVPEEA
jgi:hypothetical protein